MVREGGREGEGRLLSLRALGNNPAFNDLIFLDFFFMRISQLQRFQSLTKNETNFTNKSLDVACSVYS